MSGSVTVDRSEHVAVVVLASPGRLNAIGEAMWIGLARHFEALASEPELREIWTSNGSDVVTMSPAEFSKFLNSEIKRWAEVTKTSGARLD